MECELIQALLPFHFHLDHLQREGFLAVNLQGILLQSKAAIIVHLPDPQLIFSMGALGVRFYSVQKQVSNQNHLFQ